MHLLVINGAAKTLLSVSLCGQGLEFKENTVKSSDVLKTKIHREGNLFIAAGFFASAVLFLIWPPMGWIALVISAFILYFFRDPQRIVPDGDGLVISPADGTVATVGPADPPKEIDGLDGDYTRISVFLSVFNVHVNRIPVAGTVSALRYIPGEFLDAADDKASEQNERQLIMVDTKDNKRVVLAQVAGLVARRILCDLEVDQKVEAGERFGLIRFGSRTDIYLPKGYDVLVKPGQTMIGGETVLARPK